MTAGKIVNRESSVNRGSRLASLLFDYAEQNDGRRFVQTLKKYTELARQTLDSIIKVRKAAEDPQTVNSLLEKEEDFRKEYSLAANTSEVAKKSPGAAMLYWPLFSSRTNLSGDSRFLEKADEIRDLACLLLPESAKIYLERLVTVILSNISLKPGWPKNMPQTTQVLLYSAGESTSQVDKAFGGQSILQFLEGIDKVNVIPRPVSELFMELLFSYDTRLDYFYLEISNLVTEFQVGAEEETSSKYNDILSSMHDCESNIPRILDLAAEAGKGNIDDLVICHQFRESKGFMESYKLLLEGHKDALTALAYLMLFTGKSQEADALLHRVDLVEGRIGDVSVYEKILETVKHRRKYAAEQAIDALLDSDAERICAIFAPEPEVVLPPRPGIVQGPSQEGLMRQSALEAASKGIALYSLTDKVAEKQFERLQFSSAASRFFGQMQKGSDFRKVPLPEKFFTGFGLYLINHEPGVDLDEAAILVADIFERGNMPYILLVGPEQFRDGMAERLIGLVPDTAGILHYNNKSGNGYFNLSSIHIDDVIKASVPVGAYSTLR